VKGQNPPLDCGLGSVKIGSEGGGKHLGLLTQSAIKGDLPAELILQA